MCNRFVSAILALGSLLIPALALAQGATGSVGGAVRDQQNLVIPGATVTVAATDTALTRTVTSGADGGFESAGLLPGEHVLTIGPASKADRALDREVPVGACRSAFPGRSVQRLQHGEPTPRRTGSSTRRNSARLRKPRQPRGRSSS